MFSGTSDLHMYIFFTKKICYAYGGMEAKAVTDKFHEAKHTLEGTTQSIRIA